MAVSRQNAYIGEQLILKMSFSSNTGQPVEPSEILRVEIQTLAGVVLETIVTTIAEGSGVHRVTTSASWNTVARTVKDVWFYKATTGGIERQAIGQTNITLIQSNIPGQLLTPAEILAIPIGVDLTGYSTDQIAFWSETATGMIEDYTSRKFGIGTYTERGETVVDRSGRIIISTKALPIDSVTSVDVYVPGTQTIALNTQYLDIYKDKGYMYYNTQASIGVSMTGAYPSVVLTRADRVSYEIVYEVSNGVPILVKQAIAIIVGNLAKKNKIMQETGVSGVTGSVNSFRSGDYSVKFGQNESRDGYKPQGRGTDDILSPEVMEILKRYKFIKQNLY